MFTFDCHAHVYETTHAIEGARYQPSKPAPLKNWLSNLENHGLIGGVLVQVSFLGCDNSEMLSALSKLERSRFAGVAVTPISVSEDELDALLGSGVTGIRWNLVRGAEVPDLDDANVQRFLGRLADREMHLEVHLEGPRLAPLLPRLLRTGPSIVIDHFGLPSNPNPEQDPLIQAVRGQDHFESLFVKFAGHYRSKIDVAPHAAALISALPSDHFVWGSDWPHTQFENVVDFEAVATVRNNWSQGGSNVALKRLYGLCDPLGEDHQTG